MSPKRRATFRRPAARPSQTEPARPTLGASLRRGRVALRIARRSSVRSPGRSALIVALIALPVVGMAAVTLIIPSTQPTTAERIRVNLGQTQAQVRVVSPPDDSLVQDPLSTGWGQSGESTVTGDEQPRSPTSLFPAGTAMIPILDTSVTVKTRTGIAALGAVEGKAWDPAMAGRYNVIAGHTPGDDGDIMVTKSTLARLGIRLGGTAQIVSPVTRTVRVVGVIDDRTEPDSTQELFGMPGAFGGDTDIAANMQTVAYLPNTVLDWQQVQKLNKQGAVVLSRQVFEHPPAPGTYSMSGGSDTTGIAFMLAGMVMGFALLEVTLLAGAAFTVGARAQERSLATVASVGSNRSTLFSIITANGLVLGAVGGVIGVAVGIGAGSVFMRLASDGSGTQFWGYHLWWPAMIGIAAVAIIVGWIGALVPAIRVSKFDIVAALRGAKRPTVPSRKRPIAGVVVVLVGVATTILGGVLTILLTREGMFNNQNPRFWAALGMLLVGPVLTQLGLLMCSGLLLRMLARLLSRTGVAARLASRDAARNPGRSVPALAVIMTTVFAAVFAMTMMTSSQATNSANYQYSTMPGQVTLPLHYWDQQVNKRRTYTDPGQFQSALRENLDVDTVRTLAFVPSPGDFVGHSAPTATDDPDQFVPVLAVPPANQCPAERSSLNFNPASQSGTADAYDDAKKDWRCQNAYVIGGTYGGADGQIVVGSHDDLALILGAKPSTAARNMLANGGAVSLHPEYVENDSATIIWRKASYWENPPGVETKPPARTAHVKAVVEEPVHSIQFGMVISSETADKLGLTYASASVLASTETPPTQAQVDALNGAIDTLIQSPGGYHAQVERGPHDVSGVFSWGILGLSALIAIAAAAVAIGLARFDGRGDQATLNAVGSSPGVRRGFGFWQAIVLAGTGAVLGSAVGLVPAVALTLPGSGTMFAAPWLPIIMTATVMPLAIACGSWLIAGRRKAELRRAAIE